MLSCYLADRRLHVGKGSLPESFQRRVATVTRLTPSMIAQRRIKNALAMLSWITYLVMVCLSFISISVSLVSS